MPHSATAALLARPVERRKRAAVRKADALSCLPSRLARAGTERRAREGRWVVHAELPSDGAPDQPRAEQRISARTWCCSLFAVYFTRTSAPDLARRTPERGRNCLL